MTKSHDCTLGLFAKQPIPGQVKTRLAGATSPRWAADFAEAMLLDTLDLLAALPCRRVIAFAPTEAEGYFTAAARGRFELMPQSDGDLGKRMADFFELQFAAGARRVGLVGSDSPTLPLNYLLQALDALVGTDVALGPARDGGYYLIGLRRPLPMLFADIAWSGPQVLAQTLERLPPDCSLTMLPVWYDLDSVEDCRMARGHLAALRRAGQVMAAARTEKALVTMPDNGKDRA